MQVCEHQIPRLLAIDDSELIHRLLKSRLRGERLEIHAAMTAEEGLEMARALLPEVILLDIDLPDQNGFDVLRELKTDSMTHDIPVIFVSGSTDADARVRGLDMGAHDFVAKPFDMAELKARIRSAVRICLLIKMLAQRAQIDGLTGLWNRAYFDQRLKQEFAEATRYGRDLSLILCDLDHFKTLNDDHGHPFGDQVLEDFAEILSSGRGGDVPCRYGGEEFVVILPDTPADEAMIAANQYREAIRNMRREEHPDVQSTASFGVADLKCLSEVSTEHLVDAADKALYQAKQQGRDRVCLAGQSDQNDLKLSA